MVARERSHKERGGAASASHARIGRTVTLDAVARAAGVSRATVSRVVNGNPRVSPFSRQAVERAVERLGYVPNQAARALVTRRSGTVAVVIREPANGVSSDPFFPQLLMGVSAELALANLQLVLMIIQPSEEARTEAYLAAGHVDGALLTSLHSDDRLPDRLRERGVAVVVGGRPPAGSTTSYVDVDNEHGARSGVEHLLSLGRHRVATITGPPDMSPGIDRLNGYRDALARAGFAVDADLEATGDFTRESGARAMRGILDRCPDVDALFAASDLMAVGALSELRRRGRRVPEDVAVVGYDDSAIAAAAQPPLSSVRQPIEEMGREMTRLLLQAIEARSATQKRVLLGTSLTIRQSTIGGDA